MDERVSAMSGKHQIVVRKKRAYERRRSSDLDQFYTRPDVAATCWRLFHDVLRSRDVDVSTHDYVEPSAGAGAFYALMPAERRVGMDVRPACEGVTRLDYLTWNVPGTKRHVVVGNPPFGLDGGTALRFLKKSSGFADAIGFVVPQQFQEHSASWRRMGIRMVSAHALTPDAFVWPGGSAKRLATMFLVWLRRNFR